MLSFLLVRKMQNKTTPRYYFSSFRLANIEMLSNTPSFNADRIIVFLKFDIIHSIRNVLALSNSKHFEEFKNIYKYN